MDADELAVSIMDKYLSGFSGTVEGHTRKDGGSLFVLVSFPDMRQATICADNLCKEDPEFEDIAPRWALSADMPEGVSVKSIHDPVTIGFEMNDAWIRRVTEDHKEISA